MKTVKEIKYMTQARQRKLPENLEHFRVSSALNFLIYIPDSEKLEMKILEIS